MKEHSQLGANTPFPNIPETVTGYGWTLTRTDTYSFTATPIDTAKDIGKLRSLIRETFLKFEKQDILTFHPVTNNLEVWFEYKAPMMVTIVEPEPVAAPFPNIPETVTGYGWSLVRNGPLEFTATPQTPKSDTAWLWTLICGTFMCKESVSPDKKAQVLSNQFDMMVAGEVVRVIIDRPESAWANLGPKFNDPHGVFVEPVSEAPEKTPFEEVIDQVRDWLKQGATICATDPKGDILKTLPDGSCHGGLKIQFPESVTAEPTDFSDSGEWTPEQDAEYQKGIVKTPRSLEDRAKEWTEEYRRKLFDRWAESWRAENIEPPHPLDGIAKQFDASAQDILKAAAETIGARAAERDTDSERSMGRCVEAFNALTRHTLSEADGWLFMQVLKQARSRSGKKVSIDSFIDGSAYFALEGECVMRNGGAP